MHPFAYSARAVALAMMFNAVPLVVLAQDDSDGNDWQDWNHFGLDFQLGFNIRAKFMDGAGVIPPPPSAGSAVNRGYLDGFVNVDSSGNAGGQTWNWGYQNASQVSGGMLRMDAGTTSSLSSGSGGSDANPGFELSYVRDLDHENWGRWGIKASFGYTKLDMSSDDAESGSEITDAYPLNGIVPPLAPYSGSYYGPGPVIGSTPTRTTLPVTITGNRSIDATLFDFHLGPSVDLDLTRRLSVELGGGAAFGLMDSTFAFSETSTTSGGATYTSGSTRDVGWLFGTYAEAGLTWRLCRAASVHTGAEFQYLGQFEQNTEGHSSEVDLGQSVFWVIGLEYHF
jgi:hypothetical protein